MWLWIFTEAGSLFLPFGAPIQKYFLLLSVSALGISKLIDRVEWRAYLQPVSDESEQKHIATKWLWANIYKEMKLKKNPRTTKWLDGIWENIYCLLLVVYHRLYFLSCDFIFGLTICGAHFALDLLATLFMKWSLLSAMC